MKTYPIPMVPGPTSVPETVRNAYLTDYGSADMELEFLDLYSETCSMMQTFFGTKNDIILHTGEGMIALWGALKSVLIPNDRVLAISTGIFGSGIGKMAEQVGAEVKTVEFPFNATVNDLALVEAAIEEFKPKMITVVHCETPSGTLNPIAGIGELKRKHNIPLLYMDCVASMCGATVEADAWGVDLALGGSQKALSVPPSMTMVAISPKAKEYIHSVGYIGYDAFLPFEKALDAPGLFPYTPNWHGVAALHAAGKLLLDEGLENVFQRHAEMSAYCMEAVQSMGLGLFYADGAIPSPTVTAVNVPEGWTWEDWDIALREKGLVVGGSYGPMAGKVFRIGHMGNQARKELVDKALNVIEEVMS
jgi:aspartate aminotransferase-like enzyme